jgi:hypothetical protein
MSQPRTGGEKQILSAFLDQQRDVVLWKLDGLTDDQLRQPITPGGCTCWVWSNTSLRRVLPAIRSVRAANRAIVSRRQR